MEKLLKIKTNEDKIILIREQNICTARRHNQDMVFLTMTNGDKIICVDPPYEMWENESLAR